MVEFLIGLVGLLVLMLGLFQLVGFVDEDFESLLGSREQVARTLTGRSSGGGASASGAATYQDEGFYDYFQEFIRYEDYSAYMEPYVLSRVGFEAAVDDDPMDTMVGFEDGKSVDVESGLMRRVMGERMTVRNEVWMPSWDDLLQ